MRTEGVIAFTASILINVAAVGTFDRPLVRFEQRLVAQKESQAAIRKSDEIQLNFVEAPPKTASRKPIKTRKISNRDSVAQDRTPEKQNALPQDAPKTEKAGPSDQLTQRRMLPSQLPSRASAASQEKPPSTEQDKELKPEEKKTRDSEVKPQAPMQGSATADKINTQLSSMTNSRGAQLYGMTSFEATGSGMGQYMKNMKERIWLAWFPYIAYQYPKDFKSADVVLEFRLNAQGDIKNVQVAYSKGSPLFAAFCAQALQRAGNFGPLPQEFLALIQKDEFDIKFAFHYW